MEEVTVKQLAQKVKEMRDAQRTYFREARKGNETNRRAALEHSKKLEGELDAIIQDILDPINKQQINLF